MKRFLWLGVAGVVVVLAYLQLSAPALLETVRLKSIPVSLSVLPDAKINTHETTQLSIESVLSQSGDLSISALSMQTAAEEYSQSSLEELAQTSEQELIKQSNIPNGFTIENKGYIEKNGYKGFEIKWAMGQAGFITQHVYVVDKHLLFLTAAHTGSWQDRNTANAFLDSVAVLSSP